MLSRFIMAVMVAFISVNVPAYAATPKELQKEADVLREQGESLKAIDLYNQAIVGYEEEKDYTNMLQALTGRLLSWKHIFYKTQAKVYAIFVEKESEAIAEIAKEYHLMDKMYLVHFLNATAALQLGNYPSAEQEFRQAVGLYPADNAEKGDWIAHLGDAMYRNGQKEEGKKEILQGIQQINDHASEVDSFLVHVWVSGAYLRLAKLLKTDNPQESQAYLNQAKNIIDSDSRLVIRKQQLEAF